MTAVVFPDRLPVRYCELCEEDEVSARHPLVVGVSGRSITWGPCESCRAQASRVSLTLTERSLMQAAGGVTAVRQQEADPVAVGHLCPHCGGKLVIRVNGTTKKPFWGCTGFPACRGSRSFTGREVQAYDARLEAENEARDQAAELAAAIAPPDAPVARRARPAPSYGSVGPPLGTVYAGQRPTLDALYSGAFFDRSPAVDLDTPNVQAYHRFAAEILVNGLPDNRSIADFYEDVHRIAIGMKPRMRWQFKASGGPIPWELQHPRDPLRFIHETPARVRAEQLAEALAHLLSDPPNVEAWRQQFYLHLYNRELHVHVAHLIAPHRSWVNTRAHFLTALAKGRIRRGVRGKWLTDDPSVCDHYVLALRELEIFLPALPAGSDADSNWNFLMNTFQADLAVFQMESRLSSLPSPSPIPLPPATEKDTDTMAMTTNPASGINSNSTSDDKPLRRPRTPALDQAKLVGGAIADGIAMGAVDKIGDVFLGMAKKTFGSIPGYDDMAAHPVGKEVIKILIAGSIHTASETAGGVLPGGTYVSAAARQQIRFSSGKLTAFGLHELGSEIQQLVELGRTLEKLEAGSKALAEDADADELPDLASATRGTAGIRR